MLVFFHSPNFPTATDEKTHETGRRGSVRKTFWQRDLERVFAAEHAIYILNNIY